MENKNIHGNLYLDIIRIIATLLVLLTHIGQNVGFEFTGSSGVQCFFILSGYLACTTYKKYNSPKEYYVSRIRRIVPSYYSCLFVIIAFSLLLGLLVDESYLEIISFKFIRYILFVHQIIPSNNYWLWCNSYALWTMSSFAVFYLLVPLLCKINKKRTYLFFVFAISFIILYYSESVFLPLLNNIQTIDNPLQFIRFYPLTNLFYFLLGFIIYDFVNNKKGLLFATANAAIIIIFLITRKGLSRIPTLLYTICITLAVNSTNNCKSNIFTNAISIISSKTFSIYLFHSIAIVVYNNCFYGTLLISNQVLYTIGLFIFSIIFSLFFEKTITTSIKNIITRII